MIYSPFMPTDNILIYLHDRNTRKPESESM